MPMHVAARGETVVERVRHFLDNGLPARFAAAPAILPAMSDEARVVLVGGNTSIGSASCRRIKSDKGVGLTGRGSLTGHRSSCGHPLTGVGRFSIWPAAQQAVSRARPSADCRRA
jgi:hypothetical protein